MSMGFPRTRGKRKTRKEPWTSKQIQQAVPKIKDEAVLGYRPPTWDRLTKQIFLSTYRTYQGQTVKIQVRKHTDTTDFWEDGNHIFVVGQTGTGKSVFLLNMAYLFYQLGKTVIHRDDGGLESLLLAPIIKDFHVWIPEGVQFQAENWEHMLPNEPNRFDPKRARKLVRSILAVKGFHTIIFDAYCMMGDTTVKFWGPFFKELIFALQQEPTHLKESRVLSTDELNDIIQPSVHAWTPEHKQARGLMESAIRKLRKHRVKIIASCHRPNQLPINVRSQFAYFIFKQTFPKDAYDLLNHMMAAIPNKLFWLVLQDIVHKLQPWQFYLFDKRGRFDKFTNKDVPRWKNLLTPKELKRGVKVGLKTIISGSIDELYGGKSEDLEGMKFDLKDLIIFFHRASPKASPHHETLKGLVDRLESLGYPLAKTTIYDRTLKMRKADPWLDEYLTMANR